MQDIPDNFLEFFLKHCQTKPNGTAVVFYPEDKEEVYSYFEFHQLIHSYYEQFKLMGVQKKDGVILFTKLGPDFYACTMALIALGATPIFIDPKMKNLSKNIQLTRAKFILMAPEAIKYRLALPFLWKIPWITFEKTGRGYKTLFKGYQPKKPMTLATMKASDPLIISYTTGSTGLAKAADRNYEVSYHQFFTSLNYWHHNEQTIDMTFFPVVVFQNLKLGIPTVVPNLNKKNISQFDFPSLIKVLKRWGVKRISAAPGYLNALCKELGSEKILSVEKLITGGAPVPHWLSKKITHAFPLAECHIVYGSTEAEPISFVDMRAHLDEKKRSYNVGIPINEIEINFLDSDKKFSDSNRGEIVISGKHVVKSYVNNPEETKKFKIKDKDGRVWHRTGDMGFKDQNGHLHILGREKHSLKLNDQVRYSLELERELDLFLPEETRRAIKIGHRNKITLFIESEPNPIYKEKIKNYFLNEYKLPIRIKFLRGIPVDRRHHWKINYSELR